MGNRAYHPRTAIKAQTLGDFIVEFTILDEDNAPEKVERWTIQTDDSSTRKRGGLWIVIITPEGVTLNTEFS